MFTIQIIESKYGKPAYYKKVSVGFNGLLRGFARDQYTDKNGEAHFSEDNGDGKIYIDGKVAYEGYISGRKIIYI